MRLLTTLFCLTLCCQAGPVLAQSPIYRCIGANGGAVFSDQPCAALQATPVGAAAKPAAADATTSAPPILCAATAAKLRQSITEAFARRDPNRLAGLMLWDGDGRASATADIKSLNDMMKQSLLDISMPGAAVASGANQHPASTSSLGGMGPNPFASSMPTTAPASIDHQLVLQTAGSGGAQERRFDVVRRAGCLWLRD